MNESLNIPTEELEELAGAIILELGMQNLPRYGELEGTEPLYAEENSDLTVFGRQRARLEAHRGYFSGNDRGAVSFVAREDLIRKGFDGSSERAYRQSSLFGDEVVSESESAIAALRAAEAQAGLGVSVGRGGGDTGRGLPYAGARGANGVNGVRETETEKDGLGAGLETVSRSPADGVSAERLSDVFCRDARRYDSSFERF